jgi:tetratricopeptide (TPR) repeat protein
MTTILALMLAIGLAATANDRAPADSGERLRPTTAGSIALANLDHQIERSGDGTRSVDLLLARSRFLGDYDALDRAVKIAEGRAVSADDLLRRARVRAAAHRFAEALADLEAAKRAGADERTIDVVRATVLVATGRGSEAVGALEEDASLRPGYAAYAALASAYAELGRYDEADRLYAAAIAELRTTSPFPYAWLYFARGKMWSEQAGDPARGESLYAIALVYLPEFAVANIHRAELESARGEFSAAIVRLENVVARSDEPEAWAKLGEVRLRQGERAQGERDIAHARRRYEALLARHPLAFADHAAEFYLGPGADPERAWRLAALNLENRQSRRAYALAIEAAVASGRNGCTIAAAARAKLGLIGLPPCRPRSSAARRGAMREQAWLTGTRRDP